MSGQTLLQRYRKETNLELFDPLFYGVYISAEFEASQLTEFNLRVIQPSPYGLQICDQLLPLILHVSVLLIQSLSLHQLPLLNHTWRETIS